MLGSESDFSPRILVQAKLSEGNISLSPPALLLDVPDKITCADFVAFRNWCKNGGPSADRVGDSCIEHMRTSGWSDGTYRIVLNEGCAVLSASIGDSMISDAETILEGHDLTESDLSEYSIWLSQTGSRIADTVKNRALGIEGAFVGEVGNRVMVMLRDNCLSVVCGRVLAHPNLMEPSDGWLDRICDAQGICRDLVALKIGLINNGVVCTKLIGGHGFRAGVNGSIDIVIECQSFAYGGTCYGEFPVNCSYGNRISRLSPFSIEPEGDIDSTAVGLFYLGVRLRNADGKPLVAHAFTAEDPLRLKKTADGTLVNRIAFVAMDRVRFQHNCSCGFAESGVGCRFCEFTSDRPLGYPNADFGMDSIEEAVQVTLESSRPYSEYLKLRGSSSFDPDCPYIDHVLIGGGSILDDDSSISRIVRMCQLINKYSERSFPIYAMMLPPRKESDMMRLREAGVSEVAFNMEIFDPHLAEVIMPGKSAITREEYLKRLSLARSVWPEPGAVRSALILGLEPLESTLCGVTALADRGVSPMLSLFRPTEGTELEDVMPLDSETVYATFLKAYTICRDRGVELGPSCLFCQNNTLSMPRELVERYAWPVSADR